MSTAIVPVNGQATPAKAAGLTLQVLDYYAQSALEAGFFGRDKVKTKGGAVMLILAGHNWGIDPFTALTEIDMIDGKPSPSGNLLRSLVNKNPEYGMRITERTNTRCAIEWYRGGKLLGTSEWTMEDAARAGLAGKDNWRKYPRAMLLNRTTTEGVRAFMPEISCGVNFLCPEEMGVLTNSEGDALYDKNGRTIKDPLHNAPYLPAKDDTPDAVIVTPDEQREEKIEEIANLLDANSIDEKKFLAHYKVANIAGMTPAQMDKALTLLRARDTARYAKEKLDAESQHVASDDGMPVAEPAE